MTINVGGGAGASTAFQLDENDCFEVQDAGQNSGLIATKTVAGRVRIDVPLSSTQFRVVFDPASIERARHLEQLNHAMRLGFRPPKSSTR